MELRPLAQQITEHYREFLPKAYRQMKAAGTLETFALNKAEAALDQMAVLQSQGYQPTEAWEVARADLFPEEENPSKEAPATAETYRLHRQVNHILSNRD